MLCDQQGLDSVEEPSFICVRSKERPMHEALVVEEPRLF